VTVAEQKEALDELVGEFLHQTDSERAKHEDRAQLLLAFIEYAAHDAYEDRSVVETVGGIEIEQKEWPPMSDLVGDLLEYGYGSGEEFFDYLTQNGMEGDDAQKLIDQLSDVLKHAMMEHERLEAAKEAQK
jgi:hypothetical protein